MSQRIECKYLVICGRGIRGYVGVQNVVISPTTLEFMKASPAALKEYCINAFIQQSKQVEHDVNPENVYTFEFDSPNDAQAFARSLPGGMVPEDWKPEKPDGPQHNIKTFWT